MNMVNVVNAIINDGANSYQTTIPEATQDNIEAVGNAILSYNPDTNLFLNTLVNKIVLSIIEAKIASNPLAVLKKGENPLGADIEEIFVNMAKPEAYDPTGAGMLTQDKPDVKVIYHRLNRKDKFKKTVSRENLAQAFTSYGAMENLITGIINSLYSGDNYAEFVLTKNLLADACRLNHVKNVIVPVIADQTVNGVQYSAVDGAPKALVKAIRTCSSAFQFASSNFNKFADVNPEHASKPVVTWTPREDQIIIIRSDVATEIDVEVLAQAFNMEKATLLANMLEIDNFGKAENIYAMLIDKSFTKIFDNLYHTTELFNPDSMTWTYWLHHWQTYSYSLFANAVAFGFVVPGEIYAFDALTSKDGGKVGAPTYANDAAVKAALPTSVTANDGTVTIPVASWTNTDTYNAGVAGSYTYTAVLGTLPTGYTNPGSKTATIEIVVATA